MRVETPEPRWMRLLDWLEDNTPGGRWPWGQIWLWRGFAFHFASGVPTGFSVTVPLPRMLPGFVKPYQVQSLRMRDGRRKSDLSLTVPLFPPGWPSAYRTIRFRRRR
jgi:hypothetical protein